MKLGIALGGGGAKGLAHLGILRVLLENGVQPAVVAGTSIGALVGAAYAADALDAFEREILDIALTDIPFLLSPAWSVQGFFSGKSALELLGEVIKIENIEQLSRPFAAVSADLLNGERVVFTRGDLRQALRASFSIPGLFSPVRHNDSVLIDGGVIDPVPVEICRALGADIVIAVDLFGPEDPAMRANLRKNAKQLWPVGIQTALNHLKAVSNKFRLPQWSWAKEGRPGRQLNIIDVVEGTLAISQRQLTQYRLLQHPADVLIQPQVGAVGLLDFHRGEAVMELGRQAATGKLSEISEKLGRN